MKAARSVIAIILAVMTVFLCACEKDDGGDRLFRYSLYGNPGNLDPQMATDAASLTVLSNMMEGLVKSTSGGRIVPAGAESYTVSEDEKVYTFTLKKGRYWYSAGDFEAEVTADDYVYGFERLFDRTTGSPHSEEYFCIRNAAAVRAGAAAPSDVGVKALDDYTLQITLEYVNPNFLQLLAAPPAMPCNREFFAGTKGKYGLEDKCTASNGSFYIKIWQYDRYSSNNYIIMRRNKKNNTDSDRIYPSSLNFFIEKTTDDIKSTFLKGNAECIVTAGQYKEIFGGSYISEEYMTGTAGIVFNTEKDSILQYPEARKALFLTLDRSAYEEKLPRQLENAYAIIPPGVTLLNKSYRELVSERDKTVLNRSEAARLWNGTLEKMGVGSVGGGTILVSENFPYADVLSHAAVQWQRELQYYCGVQVVSEKEYADRVAAGDYDMLFVQLECSYDSPDAMLTQFSEGNAQLQEILAHIKNTEHLSDSVSIYDAAEKLIMEQETFLPLFYTKKYLTYVDEAEGIVFNPFTEQIDFQNAKLFD